MSGLDKNRLRNKNVNFRMSLDEIKLLESRRKLTGKGKAEFIIESILKGEINIVVGKYESDRLGVELMRLREELVLMDTKNNEVEIKGLLLDCKNLMNELTQLIMKDGNNK